MKYYLTQLYGEIKTIYFKNFSRMRIDNQITNETFTYIMFSNLTSKDEDEIIEIDNFKTLVKDYVQLKNDENYICESAFMLDIQDELDEATEILRNKFKTNVSSITQEVIDLLKTESSESYIVGGACRDALDANISSPKDYDFATDILYDDMERLFTQEGFTVQEVGKKTLVLNISKNGENFEIANFRKDGTYTDGRRPDSVSIGTIVDDGNRRDFTCNALYFNLVTTTISDVSGTGINDCFSKILRPVGNADDRMSEDLLRIMRAYRFIGLGYFPTSKLVKSCRKNFDDMITTISPERIRLEVEKMVNLI